ncbi:hypothetical protein J3Q64DRAFT_1696193 [Phycomyces blakesleeanus]|uniref:C2H2-type zinc finger transcription factor n=2 Tax=Phycomyces blakesleeanus TaxID=4837 RepID=A0A162V9A9_PHYB8|nr:hypothetical protein PHYBLDRAFT_161654 [Phycomyces blakesleeanus NRRL 1555(-)]OAD81023.1 hypothetical protein PHYBLDRAFT_161654 [Phycomyces blakesleeanus NRRL 1555(-)]|eukprot:XP_018299063.1 hypothetical protein PHYBLDRAFT_161654 [Phycomyces blakesleeanus NRRL 1555(-)]
MYQIGIQVESLSHVESQSGIAVTSGIAEWVPSGIEVCAFFFIQSLSKGIVCKMSFSCEEANCTKKSYANMRLNKHSYDDHTLQVTISIQNTSYTVNKIESGFVCPKCNSILESTSTFKAYAERHNKSPKARKKKGVYSESDIETARRISNDMKTLTKPIATLAAVDRLEYTNLTPIALLSGPLSYYLLGDATDVQELHEQQPEVIFSIPPDPSHQPKDYETNHTLLTFLMNNCSMASSLKNEHYIELDTNHLKKANRDWLINPEARYAVLQSIY